MAKISMGPSLQMVGSEADVQMVDSEADVQLEINHLLRLIYPDKDVFLRQLISCASDALDIIRLESLNDESILGNFSKLVIGLLPDKVNKTLTIMDSGIGMTKADLVNNLGIISRSGRKEFLEAHPHYSANLVAERVSVTTKHKDEVQYIWESRPGGGFTVTRDVRGKQLPRGINITLFLKDDQLEYLEEKRIKDLFLRHSEFINYPIYIWTKRITVKELKSTEKELYMARWTGMKKRIKTITLDWKLINKPKFFWLCKPGDITIAMRKLILQ